MPAWQSFSFTFGPLLAVGVLIGLVFVLRWAFGHGGSLVRHAPQSAAPTEYGLLVPVAAPASYDAAVQLQDELRRGGIASTISTTTMGLRVFVWPMHADTARAVVRRLHGPAA